ncbi:MAG: hypothetical protein EBT78_12495 [Betaproteobacteria bacterium]|nr:hypothetical protein [Betaproteobacteria bacterium]NBT68566.1 hypothetical protein [Betaproteobacteria bacterium]
MAVEYAPKGLIGVLTPQANTTVEPEFNLFLPEGFAIINGRLTSDKPTMEERLVDYFHHYIDSCKQFANAPVDVIAFACTGASYLATRPIEIATLESIERQFDIKAVTAASSVIDMLDVLHAKNIALVSPYSKNLLNKSKQYWESCGFHLAEVVDVASSDAAFHPIYGLTSQSASQALDQLKNKSFDAIVLLGTGMPTLKTIYLANQSKQFAPVISCMSSLAWRCATLNLSHAMDFNRWLTGDEGSQAGKRWSSVDHRN